MGLEKFDHLQSHEQRNRDEVGQQDKPVEEGSPENVDAALSEVEEDVRFLVGLDVSDDCVGQGGSEANSHLNCHDDDDISVGLQFDFGLLHSCFQGIAHHFCLVTSVTRDTVDVACVPQD